MSVLFTLSLIFIKLGFLSFGGGYTVIALLENEIINNNIAIDSETLGNIISISSSSPGPVAINIACSLGYTMYGLLGAIVCAISVVLPSFLIVLTAAYFFERIHKLRIFEKTLSVVHPVIAAIIISVALSFLMKNNILDIKTIINPQNIKSIFIIALSFFVIYIKNMNPIIMICAGGVFGLIFF